MKQLSKDWLMGAIDVASSFGISVSLQDPNKPYLKWFFMLKMKDETLAKRIRNQLEIGTIRKVGNRYCFVVERIDDIQTLSNTVDFSMSKSKTTHRDFMLWFGAYLHYRQLSPYERGLKQNIIPILRMRDELNADRKTPRYNDCETIIGVYGWS